MVDLLRVTPESRGIASEAIGRFINDVQKKNLELHSFILQKDGAVVAEGWWMCKKHLVHTFYILSVIVQKQVGKNINDYLYEKFFKRLV